MLGATLRDVGEGMRGRRGRFALSFLAVAVGVVALTLLIAVLTALHQKSRRLVQELGANVVAVIDENGSRGRDGLKLAHAELLANNLARLKVSSMRRYTAPTLGTRQQLSVIASDEQLLDVRQWRLDAGRFLDAVDLRERERHAVVSRPLAETWGWRPGSIVYVADIPFMVVGVIDIGGGTLEGGSGDTRLALGDRAVIIPRSVIPYWSKRPDHDTDAVDAIFVRGANDENARQILPAVQRILAQPDLKAGKLSWITPESLVEGVSNLQNIISLVAGTIAGLCLVLGGTTLMSLMVANVRERVTEIGLRRAMGATRGDIAVLFVAEAVLVTVAAGLAGTFAAHLLLGATGGLMPLPVAPSWASLALPPLVAVVLGVAFSYWPARAAARISPAEALRDE